MSEGIDALLKVKLYEEGNWQGQRKLSSLRRVLSDIVLSLVVVINCVTLIYRICFSLLKGERSLICRQSM